MSKQDGNRMHIFRKIFFVLLVFDIAELIMSVANLYPTFKQLGEYGQLMLIVTGVITAIIVGSLLFEIIAKIFLIRTTLPTFSGASGRKGYTATATCLLLVNLFSVLFNLLSAGGEGASLINQTYLYLQILASAVEVGTIFCYLRTIKKIFINAK